MPEIKKMVAGEDLPIVIAAVEGGGTSFVVAVAQFFVNRTAAPTILVRHEVDSSHDNPAETLKECASFLENHKPTAGYDALGIATFGPVGLDKSKRATYGRILPTSPKQSWRDVDLISPLEKACKGTKPLAIKIDTDVNAPAMVEYRSAMNILSSVAYVTVGTGVGVGLVIHGQPVHGRMHPEGGHVPVQPLPGDGFEGYSWGEKSPFQGRRTVEGLASSVALTERLEVMLGKKGLPRSCLSELEDDHPVWDHCANALANLCVTLILTTSVEKIVIGGGIMKRNGLIEKIRRRTVILLNGYLSLPDDMSEFITTSQYGADIGLMGAIALAQQAHEEGSIKEMTTSNSTAFNVGLIHGIVVGVAAAFVGFSLLRRSK